MSSKDRKLSINSNAALDNGPGEIDNEFILGSKVRIRSFGMRSSPIDKIISSHFHLPSGLPTLGKRSPAHYVPTMNFPQMQSDALLM